MREIRSFTQNSKSRAGESTIKGRGRCVAGPGPGGVSRTAEDTPRFGPPESTKEAGGEFGNAADLASILT